MVKHELFAGIYREDLGIVSSYIGTVLRSVAYEFSKIAAGETRFEACNKPSKAILHHAHALSVQEEHYLAQAT